MSMLVPDKHSLPELVPTHIVAPLRARPSCGDSRGKFFGFD
jgi:hypothetical protein